MEVLRKQEGVRGDDLPHARLFRSKSFSVVRRGRSHFFRPAFPGSFPRVSAMVFLPLFQFLQGRGRRDPHVLVGVASLSLAQRFHRFG